MKIKTYIQHLLATVVLIMLVGGFQFTTDNESKTSTISLTESILGVEEAYAGPCADAGCDGDSGYCGTTTVVKLFGLRITKDCVGSEPGEFPTLN